MHMRIGLVLLAALSIECHADYLATGPIKGTVCTGWGIEVCEQHVLAAVKGRDGKLYEIDTRFQTVDEYNERRGSCSVITKSRSGGLISAATNMVAQPVFYERDDHGKYAELDVDYVTFPCIRQ